MPKQKLISFITKKQNYKQLKPTINQIAKENTDSVKNSVSAVLQILTKQYNAQSKLYALRFLKDCFEAGSKLFIKSTSQNLLPIIANIVIESTDQQAITKYAGSSFTKSTDLEKFKSIMVSFFKLAKQCIMKWAEWVPNQQYKFVPAYNSLLKKGVRFDPQFKYFRPENQTNFQKNCRVNNFPLIIQSNNQPNKKDDSKAANQKVPPQKQVYTSKNAQSAVHKQEKPQIVQQTFQLSKRYGPKSKNKYILKCHQIFKTYDQKLKSGTMKQTELEEMDNQVNSQLQEYMGLADLDQNQMESQLTGIFENIKNVKEDFAKMKALKSKAKIESSELKDKKLTISKTENLTETKKVEVPHSPIHQLTTPGSQSPRANVNRFEQTPLKGSQNEMTKIQNAQTDNSNPSQNQKPQQGASIKKVESPKMSKQVKEKKIEVFEDDTSIMESEKRGAANKGTTNNQIQKERERQKQRQREKLKERQIERERQKQQQREKQRQQQRQRQRQKEKQKQSKNSATSNNSKVPPDNKIPSRSQVIKQSTKQLKSPKNQQQPQIHQSLTKTTNKSGSAKQHFDSHIELSRTQSSRVQFSQSSADQQTSQDASRLTGNFKKTKYNDSRLSSIIEDHRQHFENSSRRHFNNNDSEQQISKNQVRQWKQPGIPKQTKSINPKDLVVQKLSLQPNQIKLQKKAIDQYEHKIKALQHHLRQKQSRQRQLEKKLIQLNSLKRQQEHELEKIRQENNTILERLSNAVEPEQYGKIKRDFEEMKLRNKKMEGNMERLNREIESLKIVQMSHNSHNLYSVNTQDKQNHIKFLQEPNRLFQQSQNYSGGQQNKKFSSPEKPEITYQPLDIDYIKNRTHLTKIHEFLDENNLQLLKKNIVGASELFFNSEEMSFICRASPFKSDTMTLKLDLSFKLNGMNKKDVKPTVNICNLQQIQVWKKSITGQDFLYHQQIVVKLKKFPFKLLKMEVSTSQHNKKSVVLPFVYFSFLKKIYVDQELFDNFFSNNKDNAIKSKVFNLNTKVVKDLKSVHLYQGFAMQGENRLCFRLFQKTQKSSFWCEMTNLSKQKCVIKVIPEPFNEEMHIKAEQVIQNLTFLLGTN